MKLKYCVDSFMNNDRYTLLMTLMGEEIILFTSGSYNYSYISESYILENDFILDVDNSFIKNQCDVDLEYYNKLERIVKCLI
jgi:hypothetical protein